MITNPLLFLKLGTRHKIERINVTIVAGIVNQAKKSNKNKQNRRYYNDSNNW
ncbi:hypothetical protein MSCd_7820 [Mycoplasma mycoides subsp. mycoides KH3J]|nr:hypothetical protein MSCc_4740 [Mycoplasma mycoides subsp. mycoides C425/93]PTD32770.1 hypothetical protein MSCd_7820 [Mycoplasma mycoides subsp. mycoides KH3J]PTD33695.1 hypothetical protein MSCe_6230 [Mycoplasma mycoides subsp. mycoides str. Gemu Goffa]